MTTKPEQFHHQFVYNVKTAKRMEHAQKLLRLFTSPEKCARQFEHCAFERQLRKNGITLIIFHHAPFKIINSIVELLRDFNLLLPPTPPPPPSTPAIKGKTF